VNKNGTRRRGEDRQRLVAHPTRLRVPPPRLDQLGSRVGASVPSM
jgi:hypothetical protein